MGTVAKIVVAILACMVLIWGIVAAGWGIKVATAGLYGRGEAHVQIHSANFMIEAYNSFHDQYGSILALEGQIVETETYLKTLEPNSREYTFASINLLSLRNLRHTAIQKYNADARKNWTEGQFRDADLPYQIPD